MNDTISGCGRTISNLRINWRIQDLIARTAMRWNGQRMVPDVQRRATARANANEILAQIDGINTAISELTDAIDILRQERSRADAFFVENEQRVRNLDYEYDKKIRDIGYDIHNFRDRINQISESIGNIHNYSFEHNINFLNWLAKHHKEVFTDMEEDARRILDNLWSGELTLEYLVNRSNLTSAESWALAKYLINIENLDGIDSFLKQLTTGMGGYSDIAGRIDGILSFLEVEERRLPLQMIPFSMEYIAASGLMAKVDAEAKRVSQLRELLAFVSRLDHTDIANNASSFIEKWIVSIYGEQTPKRNQPLDANEMLHLAKLNYSTRLAIGRGIGDVMTAIETGAINFVDWLQINFIQTQLDMARVRGADVPSLTEQCRQISYNIATGVVVIGSSLIGGGYTASVRGARLGVRVAQRFGRAIPPLNPSRVQNIRNIAERKLVRGPQNVTGGTIISISTPPPKGSLSSLEARQWYLKQLADIPNRINKNLPLEQQARHASRLRNRYRTEARNAMSDMRAAEKFNITAPNRSWALTVQKYEARGLSGDALYRAIIEGSQRSRASINASLGL